MADFSGLESHHSNFKPDVHMHTVDWIFMSAISVLLIVLIILNILLAPKLHKCWTQNQKKHPKILMCSTITFGALTLSAVCSYVSAILVLIYSDFNHQLIINDILIKISLCLYCGCQTLMIYVFTLRVDAIFSNTELAYSQKVVKSLYGTCIIFAAVYIFSMICFIFEIWSIYYVVALLWIVMYFILSLALCILFVRKVEALMLIAAKIDDDLLYIILKSVILVPFSISSSLLFFTTMTLFLSLLTSDITAIFWNILDCTISALCLFLLFASNNEYYDKCCGRIHKFCEKKEVQGMQKKMSDSVYSNSNSKKTDLTVTTTNSTMSQMTTSSVTSTGALVNIASDSDAQSSPEPSLPLYQMK